MRRSLLPAACLAGIFVAATAAGSGSGPSALHATDMSQESAGQAAPGDSERQDLEKQLKQLEQEASELEDERPLQVAQQLHESLQQRWSPLLTHATAWQGWQEDAQKTCRDLCEAGRTPCLPEVEDQLGALAKIARDEVAGLEDALARADALGQQCKGLEDARTIRTLHGLALRAAATAGAAEKRAIAAAAEFRARAPQIARTEQLLESGEKLVKNLEKAAAEASTETQALERTLAELPGQASYDAARRRFEAFDALVGRLYPDSAPPFAVRLSALRGKVALFEQRAAANAAAARSLRREIQLAPTIAARVVALRQRCCTFEPLDALLRGIAVETNRIVVGMALAADLPQQAARCEDRSQCDAGRGAVRDALAAARLYEADRALQNLLQAGCDGQPLRGELTAAWTAARPAERAAKEAATVLGATCDYAAALASAQQLRKAIADDPWLFGNMPSLEAGARAQAAVATLVDEVRQAEAAGDRTRTREHLAQAAELAKGFPCLEAQLARVSGRGPGIELPEIGRLRGLARELQSRELAAGQAAEQARAANASAAEALGRLAQHQAALVQLRAECTTAEQLAANLQASASQLAAQQRQVRAWLGELPARTRRCTQADAAAARRAYQDATRELGAIGAAAREMRRTNDGELRALLSRLATERDRSVDPAALASEAQTQCEAAAAAARDAQEAARAGSQAAAELKAGAAAWPGGAEARKLTAARAQSTRAAELHRQLLDELAALASAADAADLRSPLAAALAESAACDKARAEAEAQAAAEGSTATSCSVVPMERAVTAAEQIVTDLAAEVASATGLARTADQCMARIAAGLPAEGETPPGPVPAGSSQPTAPSPPPATGSATAAGAVATSLPTAPELPKMPEASASSSIPPLPPASPPPASPPESLPTASPSRTSPPLTSLPPASTGSADSGPANTSPNTTPSPAGASAPQGSTPTPTQNDPFALPLPTPRRPAGGPTGTSGGAEVPPTSVPASPPPSAGSPSSSSGGIGASSASGGSSPVPGGGTSPPPPAPNAVAGQLAIDAFREFCQSWSGGFSDRVDAPAGAARFRSFAASTDGRGRLAAVCEVMIPADGPPGSTSMTHFDLGWDPMQDPASFVSNKFRDTAALEGQQAEVGGSDDFGPRVEAVEKDGRSLGTRDIGTFGTNAFAQVSWVRNGIRLGVGTGVHCVAGGRCNSEAESRHTYDLARDLALVHARKLDTWMSQKAH